jgi:thiol-disulfide isomerase/thioredoxin
MQFNLFHANMPQLRVVRIALTKLSTAFLAVMLGLASTAYAFDLRDADSKPQKLAALKGKWVVVNFWATWCAPCIKEIPDIAAFAKEAGDRAQVIGIAVDWDETGNAAADAAKLKRTAKKFGHSYPLVLGDDNTEKVFGKLKGMPTTLVYDPTGKQVYNKTGVVTQELLKRITTGETVK